MPVIPYRISNIESYLPSIEPKNTDQVFALDGRNFRFDSLGPKSGFPTRLLSAFPLYAPTDVQGIRVQDRTLVFTDDAILARRDTVPFMWELLYTFASPIPTAQRGRWSAIFIDGKLFVNHPYRGFLSSEIEEGTLKLWLTPQTETTIPGLPSRIKMMDVIHGRAILVTDTTVYWGPTGEFSDLTPALGGAGNQDLDEYVKGTYIGLTGFQDGFIVWTTAGALLAEFIGGDLTWRWSAVRTEERPIGPYATVNLVNGPSVFLSRRGLMISSNGGTPEDWTPEFNEFFRESLITNQTERQQWRLEYDSNNAMLFVMLSSNRINYERAYVLGPTLNKWGIFSDRVYGFLPFTSEYFGYVDVNGFANILDHRLYYRETEPDVELGLNRHYPRLEKQLRTASSSLVSRAYSVNERVEMEALEPTSDSWFHDNSSVPATLGQKAMDSWVEVGYLRPSEMKGVPDLYGEIIELAIGSIPTTAPVSLEGDFTTSWNTDAFYPVIEDLNSSVEITYDDILVDYDDETGDVIDYQLMSGTSTLDYLYISDPSIDVTIDSVEDENSADDEIEDLNGQGINYPTLTHQVTVKSGDDGITVVNTTPELARFNHGLWSYALHPSGVEHRLRLEASAIGEFYQVRYISATFNYGGQRG